MLLSRLKEIAEDKLQQEVKDAVITVPAVSLFLIRQKNLEKLLSLALPNPPTGLGSHW